MLIKKDISRWITKVKVGRQAYHLFKETRFSQSLVIRATGEDLSKEMVLDCLYESCNYPFFPEKKKYQNVIAREEQKLAILQISELGGQFIPTNMLPDSPSKEELVKKGVAVSFMYPIKKTENEILFGVLNSPYSLSGMEKLQNRLNKFACSIRLLIG